MHPLLQALIACFDKPGAPAKKHEERTCLKSLSFLNVSREKSVQ